MPFKRLTYASRLCLKVFQSKGAVASTEKPYALASWMVSAMDAAFQVIFLGTQLETKE